MHTHTHKHTSPRGSASLVICFPSTQEGERIPCRWEESNGIILKCIPPPHSTADWGGLCAAFMKCLVLLSGKGTVNVKSSVSAITAHTGTGRPGKEGGVWPAHAPAVPAVTETKALAVQCSQWMERWRQLEMEKGWGTWRHYELPCRGCDTAEAAAPFTSPTQTPGALYALG